MTRLARWGFVLALLPIAACSSSPPPAPPAPPAPPPLSEQDSGFITAAAQGGLAEVQDGQLAAKQGLRPATRNFGQKMVDDHTPVNNQLATLATSKGVTAPTTLTDTDQSTMTKLASLHGRLFDTTYLRNQVTAHEQTVQLMQNEIATGTDPDLKAFAQQTLPTVQAHLTMARQLAHIPAPRMPKTPAKS